MDGWVGHAQVHITLGDQEGTAMIVSWVTASEPGNSTVAYGEDPARMERRADGAHTRYDYFNYTSGFIHHCTLRNLKVHLFVCPQPFFHLLCILLMAAVDGLLQHATKYYYAMGFGHTVRTFWFTTPPKPGPDVPFKFGLIGTRPIIVSNVLLFLRHKNLIYCFQRLTVSSP
jgi:acid phosphatase type 7